MLILRNNQKKDYLSKKKDREMGQDYELWNIEEVLKAYVNDPDMAKNVKIKMENLFLFLEKNSLLKCRIRDESGLVVKRLIMRSELTDEGGLLSIGQKNAVHRWLGSKSSQKSPPDMKLLEKALAEIRRSKIRILE
jgi:hypothetical protein